MAKSQHSWGQGLLKGLHLSVILKAVIELEELGSAATLQLLKGPLMKTDLGGGSSLRSPSCRTELAKGKKRALQTTIAFSGQISQPDA